MKNIFSIAAVGLLLLVAWAFLTGKIKLGMSSAPSKDESGKENKNVQTSSLSTGTPSIVHNPSSVITPVPQPAPKRNNISPVVTATQNTSSNYSLRIVKDASFQPTGS